jgi:hypothetical protein
MPRLDFPQVYRPIELRDYLPEFGDQAVAVWVNPPVDDLRQVIDAFQDTAADNEKIFACLSLLWQEWTADDVREFFAECQSKDADLWGWLIDATFAKINEHREERKKAFPVKSQ